jgi:hypothetical protein
MSDRTAILAELEALKRQDGLIVPADVVEYARDKTTALHGCFTWNNGKAAHEYRLLQARQLLRVYVRMEETKGDTVRAFVSLTTDRVQKDGGYRTMVEVLDNKQMREQMLHDAFVQLDNLQKKYHALQELAGVWQEVSKAKRRKKNAA